MRRLTNGFNEFSILIGIGLLSIMFSCAALQTQATNTSSTNVGVTAYEVAGVTLTNAYNMEKTLLKAGTITAAQDSTFQMGVYKKAFDCYKLIGTTAAIVLNATDASGRATATAKFNELNSQLPGLIAEVTKFITEVKK